MMPNEFDEIGAPPILPRRHDHACEIGKPKPWFGPPVNTCWCAERAEGFTTWLGGGGGAATVTFTETTPQDAPNVGGAA